MIFCQILLAMLPMAQELLPEPYKSVELLPYDGLSSYSNPSQMEKIFRENHIEVAVEVGCWLGASTRHIASLLPTGGRIYAIDHWKGSSEHQPGEREYWPEVHFMLQQFLSNAIHTGLAEKIVPVQMASLEAAEELSRTSLDLVYIDASHETNEVLKDLRAWFPLVRTHGILCGDDWGWPSVRAAVCQFAEEMNLKIEAEDNFWRYYE